MYEFDPSAVDVKRVYNKDDLLSITIAPSDEFQKYGQKRRLAQFYETMSKDFIDLMDSEKIQYWFRIEVSEPIGELVKTKGPRLHLHGVIKLLTNYSVSQWLIEVLPEFCSIGTVKVNHIKDQTYYEPWIRYCSKQEEIMPRNVVLSNVHEIPKFRPEGEMSAALSQPCRVGETISPSPAKGKGGRKGVKGSTQKVDTGIVLSMD